MRDITPTFGSRGQGAAYVHGKSVRRGPSRTFIRYIGEYTDNQGKRWEAWQSQALGHTFVRLEPINGGRAKWVYDPGNTLAHDVAQQNRPY